MSFKLTTETINSRRVRVVIKTSTGAEVVTLYAHPVMFYRNKQQNYKDLNVPVAIEMLYGTTLCSAEIVDKTELHEAFYNAIETLLKNVDYNIVMVRIPNEEMYNLYTEFVDKLVLEFSNLVFYKDEEANVLMNKWSSEFDTALNITGQVSTKTLIAIKKDHVKIYEKNWWDSTQEIMNEKTA